MCAISDHNLAAWAMVTNTGTYRTFKGSSHPITMGFTGLSDIVGQMHDGRALAIEVKVPGKKPTPEQYDFLRTVALNNGLAFWADSVEYVMDILKQEKPQCQTTTK